MERLRTMNKQYYPVLLILLLIIGIYTYETYKKETIQEETMKEIIQEGETKIIEGITITQTKEGHADGINSDGTGRGMNYYTIQAELNGQKEEITLIDQQKGLLFKQYIITITKKEENEITIRKATTEELEEPLSPLQHPKVITA